jgi:hypothetical protein
VISRLDENDALFNRILDAMLVAMCVGRGDGEPSYMRHFGPRATGIAF